MATGFVFRTKGRVKLAEIYSDLSSATKGLFDSASGARLSAVWNNAGAPSNGTTLAGFALPGDLLVDTTNKTLYQNTNTQASPTWTLIEPAGGTLPVGAKGTFGAGTATFGLSGNVSVQQSAAGAGNTNDTSEDTLFTYSLPANSLDVAGRALSIKAFGSFANNAHSKHARLYFGSEVVDSGANTTTGAIGWALEMIVVKTGSNTQQISSQLVAGTTHGGCTTQVGAETDTAAITIKVTGQTGTAAANDVLCNALMITAAD